MAAVKRALALTVLACGLVWALALPGYAADYPAEVRQILDQSPVEVEATGSGLGSRLLDWAVGQLQQLIVQPLAFGGRMAAYLLLGWLVISLASKTYAKMLGSVVCVGFACLCLQAVYNTVQTACQSTEEWHAYLMSFVPVLSGVMVAGGQLSQATVYSGLFLSVSSLLSAGIRALLLPGVQMYLCLSTAVCFWNEPGVVRLQELLYKAVKLLIKAAAWCFGAVLGMQSLLAQGSDGVTGGVLGNLAGALPVVGGVARQAVLSVKAGLGLMKTVLGVAAMITVSSMVLPVLLTVVLYAAALLLSAALAKGVGLEACADLSEQFSSGLQLCVCCLVLYYFLIMLSTILMILTLNGA